MQVWCSYWQFVIRKPTLINIILILSRHQDGYFSHFFYIHCSWSNWDFFWTSVISRSILISSTLGCKCLRCIRKLLKILFRHVLGTFLMGPLNLSYFQWTTRTNSYYFYVIPLSTKPGLQRSLELLDSRRQIMT